MLPGGSSTDYAYDPLMQLKTITAKDPGQNAILTRNYDYSPAGNITAKNTEHGNYAYQYNNLYRLTEAVNPAADDEAYTYDPLGNRLTSAGTTGDWNYNANNELQGYDTISFNYDDNGNMTQKAVGTDEVNYSYDVEDRLIEVRDGSNNLIATYYYDPFGRRLWKDVDGTKTYFLYSDEGLVGEYDSTGAELRTYGYAPNSNWTTDPLFQKSGGIYYWYQNDHLGTPQKITTTSGAIAWAGMYDSFGNVQIGTENITNNLRFAGQYYDAETGLYYNLNRYYDPTTGRYLRTDPYGEGLNLYAYCFNNPHSWIDPLGLCAVKKAWNWWSDLVTPDYVLNDPVNAVDHYGLRNWSTIRRGTVKVVFGAVGVVGGALAASTPTGIGQVLGTAGVLSGSSAIGFGVSQIIAGFTDNEISFMGVKEAVIQGTTSGLNKKNLLAANEILDMIPGILSGNPSQLAAVLNSIEYGLSIGKSTDQILKELEEAGLLKPDACN